MHAGKGRFIDKRRWCIQRAKRGFSDYDLYEIDSWFLTIIPEMIDELIKRRRGYPIFIEDEYLKEKGLEINKLTEEKKLMMSRECSKRWENILIDIKRTFLDTRKETCSYKNKYKKEYNKAFREYLDEYGLFGDKIKNNSFIKNSSDGSSIVTLDNNPYCFDKMNKYKNIYVLYHNEEEQIEKYINKAKSKALTLFRKYFNDLKL